MKKSFSYSRRVVVPTDDNFRPVTYESTISVEYSDEEVEENSIINSQELKELADTIDKFQRNRIKEETGITKLPMDKLRRTIR